MSDTACHAANENARNLLLTTLGAARVARWCGVSEAAIYQWLHRGTAARPVPAARVLEIASGAAGEGLDFDLGLISPDMVGKRASLFAPAQPEVAR